jgi:hypothetical protein
MAYWNLVGGKWIENKAEISSSIKAVERRIQFFEKE